MKTPISKNINGVHITGYRAYSQHPVKLISWAQRRCKLCGKYLKKHCGGREDKCHNCFLKGRTEYMKQYVRNRRQK